MNHQRKFFSLVLVLSLLLLVSIGCSPSQGPQQESDTSADLPQKIVSLTPSNTEILFALGLGDKVVGVTEYCDYPVEVKNIEKIGDYTTNVEKVVSLEPDLVVAVGSMNSQAVEALEKLGVKVLTVEPQSLEGVFETINLIAQETGTEKEADKLIKKLKADLKEVEDKVSTIPLEKRKKVFIEVGNEPLYTAGEGSFVHQLMTLAGGLNIAEVDFYSEFSAEKVIELDPQAILLTGPGDPARIGQRPGWDNIDAVRAGRISDIEPNLLVRQGPRAVEGVKAIAQFLYPELF